MSSVGICALLSRMGYALDPADFLPRQEPHRHSGRRARSLRDGRPWNVLCLTGDGVQAGDQPGAKPVFDLDCMSLLETIRIMRDNSKFLSGRKLTSAHRVHGRSDQSVRPAT
jgi:hypothetical protein